jgi:hypothetical protein
MFNSLTAQENEILLLAPVQIVALVGASDGEYNEMEEHWATKLVHGKTIGKAVFLRPYWSEVHRDFREKVQNLLSKVPEERSFRNKILSEALGQCNPILAKLQQPTAGHLYKGFLDLAEETAVASGGFFRIGAINQHEREFVHLPMLHPIDVPTLPKDQWQIEDEEQEREQDQNS